MLLIMLCQAREKNFHLQHFTISNLAGWGKRVGLKPHWPAAFVIFENVLKEGINISYKAGVFRCACPSSPGRALKIRLLCRLRLTGWRLQRRPVSLAWRLDREMRRRLILHKTGFAR